MDDPRWQEIERLQSEATKACNEALDAFLAGAMSAVEALAALDRALVASLEAHRMTCDVIADGIAAARARGELWAL